MGMGHDDGGFDRSFSLTIERTDTSVSTFPIQRDSLAHSHVVSSSSNLLVVSPFIPHSASQKGVVSSLSPRSHQTRSAGVGVTRSLV
jgi:hypothetical protein